MAFKYFILGLVSSLNNLQNSGTNSCEYEAKVFKTLIIIAGYNLNNFTPHMTIS
jgi:hypothetical protein